MKFTPLILLFFMISSVVQADYYDYRDGQRYWCTLDDEPTPPSHSSCSISSTVLYCSDGQPRHGGGCSITCANGKEAECKPYRIYESAGWCYEIQGGTCECW